jgi:hypothetical protein
MSPPGRYPWPEASKPIAVEGGIKAKSKRGAIGSQWWSQRFIAVLESYGISGRLQRGRTYARKGQVLEFSLSVGKVAARVQGSRPQPYKVSIGVLPLTTAQWRSVESRLASQALFRAKLLAGEMPMEIESIFDECGTPLFPRSESDLDMRCSCPDWGVPCKHLAAVCYVLAEAFDEDPFAMLAWRGRDKDDLLAALRGVGGRGGMAGVRAPGASRAGATGAGATGVGATGAAATGAGATGAGATGAAARGSAAGSEPAGGGPGGGAGAVSATRAVLADVTGAPLAGNLADFWSAGLSSARLRSLAAPPTTATAPDLLLRMFEPPAVQVRGMYLRDLLVPAYEQLAADE